MVAPAVNHVSKWLDDAEDSVGSIYPMPTTCPIGHDVIHVWHVAAASSAEFSLSLLPLEITNPKPLATMVVPPGLHKFCTTRGCEDELEDPWWDRYRHCYRSLATYGCKTLHSNNWNWCIHPSFLPRKTNMHLIEFICVHILNDKLHWCQMLKRICTLVVICWMKCEQSRDHSSKFACEKSECCWKLAAKLQNASALVDQMGCANRITMSTGIRSLDLNDGCVAMPAPNQGSWWLMQEQMLLCRFNWWIVIL